MKYINDNILMFIISNYVINYVCIMNDVHLCISSM